MKRTVTIVAECGSNWNPADPLESGKALIRAAAEAGADCVKFQDWFPIAEMNRPDEWKARCAPWTLDPTWISALRKTAGRYKLGFLCSVFTTAAVARAIRHNYDAIKIASSEIANLDLLRRIGRLHLPVWLSAGLPGPRNKDVLAAVMALGRLAQRHLVVLHCENAYPSAGKDVGAKVAALQQLSVAGGPGLTVGWSSHVAYPDAVAVAVEAVQAGAVVIEAHLRLQGVTPENAPDNGAWSLWPEEFAIMAQEVRRAIN